MLVIAPLKFLQSPAPLTWLAHPHQLSICFPFFSYHNPSLFLLYFTQTGLSCLQWFMLSTTTFLFFQPRTSLLLAPSGNHLPSLFSWHFSLMSTCLPGWRHPFHSFRCHLSTQMVPTFTSGGSTVPMHSILKAIAHFITNRAFKNSWLCNRHSKLSVQKNIDFPYSAPCPEPVIISINVFTMGQTKTVQFPWWLSFSHIPSPVS